MSPAIAAIANRLIMNCRALTMASAIAVTVIAAAAVSGDDAAKFSLKPPVVKFTGAQQQDGFVFASFEVTNPNDVPLPYVGYTSDSFEGGLPEGTISPIFRIELKHEDRDWKKHPVGFCGTGIGPVSLPAKKKVTFGVHLPAGDWKAARVGLTWREPAADETQGIVAWSGEIGRQDAEPKPAE